MSEVLPADYSGHLELKFHNDDGNRLSVYELLNNGAKIGDVIFDRSDFKNVKVLNKIPKSIISDEKALELYHNEISKNKS